LGGSFRRVVLSERKSYFTEEGGGQLVLGCPLPRIKLYYEGDATGSLGPWVGIASDDSPLLLKDIGTQDICALEWEQP
jgi:hypothetical protein